MSFAMTSGHTGDAAMMMMAHACRRLLSCDDDESIAPSRLVVIFSGELRCGGMADAFGGIFTAGGEPSLGESMVILGRDRVARGGPLSRSGSAIGCAPRGGQLLGLDALHLARVRRRIS
jgi:hypothetical protein